MTMFEEFAKEMNVEITTGKDGQYTGICRALATMTTEVILSDDEKVSGMKWSDQKELIKEKFYKTFPYMGKYSENGLAEQVTELASHPESTWTYICTDTTTYNVDTDIYRTEDGKLVKVDGDWIFGF